MVHWVVRPLHHPLRGPSSSPVCDGRGPKILPCGAGEGNQRSWWRGPKRAQLAVCATQR